MNRRKFLKQFSLVSLLPFLPRFQVQVYTFGAWLLPPGADPLNAPYLELSLQTGDQTRRDDFFKARGEYTYLRGRGFYGFSYDRLLTSDEVKALVELFEEGYDIRLPVIWR